MKLFYILKLLFSNYKEISEYVQKRKDEKEEEERRSRKYNLQLCYEHRQEMSRSHYSHSNCAHCNALLKLAGHDQKAKEELEKIGAGYLLMKK